MDDSSTDWTGDRASQHIKEIALGPGVQNFESLSDPIRLWNPIFCDNLAWFCPSISKQLWIGSTYSKFRLSLPKSPPSWFEQQHTQFVHI